MATKAGTPPTKPRGLANFRLIPRVETVPWIVSSAQTAVGKITLIAIFGCGICVFVRDWASWLTLISTISLTSFVPSRRRCLLAVAPILLVVVHTFREPLRLGLNLGVIAAGVLLYWCVMRWPNSRFGKRPVLFLLTGFAAIILIACAVPHNSLPYLVLWSTVGILATYIWFIAYALIDRHSAPAKELTLQLTAFRPIWGSTNTPFPKGAAYLRRIEAQSPEQLAVVQLKGLKLLVWAIVLGLFQVAWKYLFHVYLHIPTASQALAMSVIGTPVAWHSRWESQILDLVESVLEVSVFGHWVVATCRMGGYNALRNTYRPFSSRTVAEFFNRFYYYYKELIVDFFFFPAFFRYWKSNRRMRTIFATFSAACFGNVFYHFTRDWTTIRDLGIWKALANYQVFTFYSFILAAFLSFSQLRKRGPRPAGFVRGHLLPVLGVCLFFSLINVFGWSEEKFPLTEHLKYFASLFFIHF